MARESKQEVRSRSSAKQRIAQQTGISHISRQPSPVAQRALAAPGSLTPADVLMLQRTIGNRSTAKLLAPVLQPKPASKPGGEKHEQEAGQTASQMVQHTSSPSIQRHAAAHGVAPQRVAGKDSQDAESPPQSPTRVPAKPPVLLNQTNSLVLQRKRDINDIKEEELEDHNSDRNEEASKQEIGENYDKSLASGKKLMTKGLKWYVGSHDAEKPVTDTEDKVAQAGYKDFWITKHWPEITINTHRGPDVAELASGEVAGYKISKAFYDDQDFMYSNSFNIETGEFHASVNYRSTDIDVAEKNGLSPALSNSEIIWHQHKLAQRVAAQKAKEAGKEDFKPSRLTSISREEISNAQTLDTIFLTDGGGAVSEGGTVTLDDGTDEDVWALLGTPNGNSAVWLLMQHGEESGAVDIESVTYTKDGLTIRYLFDD